MYCSNYSLLYFFDICFTFIHLVILMNLLYLTGLSVLPPSTHLVVTKTIGKEERRGKEPNQSVEKERKLFKKKKKKICPE